MDAALFLWTGAAILTLAGLAGLVLPALPGAPLLFLGLVCAAWAEDFTHVGFWTLLFLGLLAALTYLVEFVASLVGAKRFGASRLALVGATVGGLVGIFFGIPGIILGPFIGAVAGELMQLRSLGQAGRVGFGTVVGLAFGVAGKLAIGITMVGLFLAVRFF
jgi:uncharacterized protein YqgC (DUF456 family)